MGWGLNVLVVLVAAPSQVFTPVEFLAEQVTTAIGIVSYEGEQMAKKQRRAALAADFSFDGPVEDPWNDVLSSTEGAHKGWVPDRSGHDFIRAIFKPHGYPEHGPSFPAAWMSGLIGGGEIPSRFGVRSYAEFFRLVHHLQVRCGGLNPVQVGTAYFAVCLFITVIFVVFLSFNINESFCCRCLMTAAVVFTLPC